MIISDEQIKWIEKALNLGVIPFVGWLIRQSRAKLNAMITENVNRIRDEIKDDIVCKFKAHEEAEVLMIRNMLREELAK